MKKKKSHLYVYASLPRTGLCNMLNVWARAYLWAKDHNAKLLAPNWSKFFRLGPLLRGEKDKRFYIKQFLNRGYVKGLKRLSLLCFLKHIPESSSGATSRGIVIFSGQGRDLLDVCERREELKAELLAQASREIRRRLGQLPNDFMAVHIRKGDFKRINRTLPESYYVRGIKLACEWNPTLPVLVFSDAVKNELSFLNEVGSDLIKRLVIMKSAPALFDLLALSKAKVLICTNGSSFSEWAACLGSMCTIWSKVGFPLDDRKMAGKIIKI